jgi:hypothetical protein
MLPVIERGQSMDSTLA